MLKSLNNTTFSEQSIEVPTPLERRISMPYKVTTFRVALCISQIIISDGGRKSIIYSYKYRHNSDFFSLFVALCQPLLVATLERSSQKYRTNPRTDYQFILCFKLNATIIFISIFGTKDLFLILIVIYIPL